MKTQPDSITVEEAATPVQTEPTAEVTAWQLEQLKLRHRLADEGRFASSDMVKAVIQKFVPNG